MIRVALCQMKYYLKNKMKWYMFLVVSAMLKLRIVVDLNKCLLYNIYMALPLISRSKVLVFGPLIKKEIKKKNDQKKIDRSFCFHYLCLRACVRACVSVSALQVTVFDVGS